jgi:N-acetylmuramoyl-L-alanine amidase
MKYEIIRDYISYGNSRSGENIEDVKFIVSHDTGNPGSSAYANRNYFDTSQPKASAHTFIDDKNILEIIPLNEIAFHVRYEVSTDNRLFGEDANDSAIGVELAYGGNIDFSEAYNRYVWYHAYLLDRYNLDPFEDIVSHKRLDPTRRTDPQNALHRFGISWDEFVNDVHETYLTEFEGKDLPKSQVKGVSIELPIKVGDSGSFVREIQEDLLKAGFSLPIYGADGTFGSETERAVMKFQKKHGLTVDGLVGPKTLDKLNEILSSSNPSKDFPLPTAILNRDDEGSEVKQLQRALKAIHFDPGSIDGIYGPLTEDAVTRFQSMYTALENDGVYGPNTRKYIAMSLEE